MNARVSAPAKVNLSLRVLGKRNDGFHEIRTVFQAVDLADEVSVEVGGRGVSVGVEGADVGPERENLAYRAAVGYLEASGETHGVRIQLVKRIPAGAGLGGGSSDAAAVLRCLSSLSSSRPPTVALHRIGAALGSDVPFFLGDSPLARASGRGETLLSLSPLPEAYMVLALPPVHVATAEAYRALARGPMEHVGGAAGASDPGSEVPRSWTDALATLHNDFEVVVAPLHDEIERSLDALRGAGASGALLSGSGAASFGLFGSAEQAERVATTLQGRLGWPFAAVRTLTRMPEPVMS